MRLVRFLTAAAGLPLLVGLGHMRIAAAEHDKRGTLSSTPIVINTWGFVSATEEAWVALNDRGSKTPALDAVEQGCSTCERLQCDGTVGFGGSPDEAGETTLDAMIMDGNSMAVGAVSDLRHVKHAISTARLVMDTTGHSMLAGLQATQFAVDMGLPAESLSTDASVELHRKWVKRNCQPNFRRNVAPDPTTSCGPYHLTSSSSSGGGKASSAGLNLTDGSWSSGMSQAASAPAGGLNTVGPSQPGLARLGAEGLAGPCEDTGEGNEARCGAAHAAVRRGLAAGAAERSGTAAEGAAATAAAAAIVGHRGSRRGAAGSGREAGGQQLGAAEPRWPSHHSHDTIAMAAIDANGNVAAGCSTNGAIHKVPGRVGDGSVPGGGAYADSEVGACGATGDGDVHLRFLPCYQVVENMRQGMNPRQSAEDAIRRIARRVPGYVGAVFALDKAGNHSAACYGWEFKYSYRDARSKEAQVITVAPLPPEQQQARRQQERLGGSRGAS